MRASRRFPLRPLVPASLLPLLLLPLLAVMPAGVALAKAFQPSATGAPAVQVLGVVEMPRALLLGPLPLPPAPAESTFVGLEVEPVPEVDPAVWPAAGSEQGVAPGLARPWREAVATGGDFELPEPGTWWLAARLQVARWTRLSFRVPEDTKVQLWLDGEKVEAAEGSAASEEGDEGGENGKDGGKAGKAGKPSGTPAARGTHLVMARVEIGPDDCGLFSLRLKTDPAARYVWVLERPVAPARFVRSLELVSIGPVAVAPGGGLVARRLAGPEKVDQERRPASVEVLDGRGRLVAADLGGPQARPVLFSPDGKQLLLARASRSGKGTDLLLWRAPDGPVRTVLEDEPDLGLVRWSADGRYLLLGSSRGAEDEEPSEGKPYRVWSLRRRLPDWEPLRHLHLLDLESGLRRWLTSPGDYVLEDAVFLPAGGRGAPPEILYGRTVPRPERPWFVTEFHRLDAVSLRDTVLAEFSGGWEVRPQGFAPAPDGRRLVFVGPPDQVGGGRPEHNVYDKQVWVLDLGTGAYRRVTAGEVAYDASGGLGGGLPGWRADGRAVVVPVQAGAQRRLGLLMPPGGGRGAGGAGGEAERPWRRELLETAGEGAGGEALSPGGGEVAFVTSSPAVPPALGLVATVAGAKPRLLERPNEELARAWRLAEPRDASTTGPGGQSIQAWWLPPLARVDRDSARVPLVVYYYGGSSPTTRGFNFTHQWLAANGYAVLVVNPRGAAGYGEQFADVHVADWGKAATADILAVLDRFLADHPEVDGRRVGIYGGSYGGFVTEYLVSETPRFAAAVSMYGISSLASYWGQGGWGWTYGDMSVGGATPWSDPDLFWRQSPLFRADRITTPLLLLHGTDDVNVPPGESEQLFTALEVQDRPVELVLFPGEGHGLSGELPDRISHREMILEWFDRWLRDEPQAWRARWRK